MSSPLLDVKNLSAGYGDTRVLTDVSLTLESGTVAALLGANGAGKTTLLSAISGLIRSEHGTVELGGQNVTRAKPHQRARSGLCLIPEGRGVFANLTVQENLRLAIPPWIKGRDISAAVDAFPVLGDRIDQVVGSMSGGQQQMVSLSRCFLSNPSVILLDEVSMGLAPQIVDEIFRALRLLAEQGTALLLVEQYVHRALQMADTVHVISQGALTFSGLASEVSEESLEREYLGTAPTSDELLPQSPSTA